MVRKWSYLKKTSILNSAPQSENFKLIDKRHTFKVFRKTTRFKRYSKGLSTIVRLKTYKITRKTEILALACFINLWSKVYMRSRQFYRYYQAIGLFNTVMPTFSPDSVKAILLKTSPVNNIFYFSCSNNVMSKYLNGSTYDLNIKSPIKNSRNCYAASVSTSDLENFDQVSSSVLYLDRNFYIPEEVQNSKNEHAEVLKSVTRTLLNNTINLITLVRQIMTKTILYVILKYINYDFKFEKNEKIKTPKCKSQFSFTPWNEVNKKASYLGGVPKRNNL